MTITFGPFPSHEAAKSWCVWLKNCSDAMSFFSLTTETSTAEEQIADPCSSKNVITPDVPQLVLGNIETCARMLG